MRHEHESSTKRIRSMFSADDALREARVRVWVRAWVWVRVRVRIRGRAKVFC